MDRSWLSIYDESPQEHGRSCYCLLPAPAPGEVRRTRLKSVRLIPPNAISRGQLGRTLPSCDCVQDQLRRETTTARQQMAGREKLVDVPLCGGRVGVCRHLLARARRTQKLTHMRSCTHTCTRIRAHARRRPSNQACMRITARYSSRVSCRSLYRIQDLMKRTVRNPLGFLFLSDRTIFNVWLTTSCASGTSGKEPKERVSVPAVPTL